MLVVLVAKQTHNQILILEFVLQILVCSFIGLFECKPSIGRKVNILFFGFASYTNEKDYNS